MDARRGVLWVVRNRAAQGFRGKGIIDVILWPGQFSSFRPLDPNSTKLPNPAYQPDWGAWQECCSLIDNPGKDPTGGALFYHSVPVGSPEWPAWATPEKLTVKIGPFHFYRAQ